MVTKPHSSEPKVSGSATNDVDTADLRAFVRLVDLGSVTAAARSLGETKGTVSRRIARLERVVGVALVDRTARKAAPTADGLAFRAKAGHAIDLLDDATAELRDRRGAPTGHLRVTAPIGLGSILLGPLLGPFVQQYPEVTIEIVLTDAVLSFGQDRIDVALRLSGGLPDSSLVAHKVFDLNGRLVASPAYVKAHGSPNRPEELLHHRLLVPPLRGTALPLRLEPIDGSEAPVELVVPGHVLAHDMLLLREAALGGAGITFATAELVRDDVAAGRLVEVLANWHMVGAALYLLTAGGPLPAKTRVFRDFLLEAFKRECTGRPPANPAATPLRTTRRSSIGNSRPEPASG